MTLGGTLIVRQGYEYDFCFEAAVRSLLGVCDEVVVVDGFSTDGTHEKLQEIARAEPKLRVVQREWKPSPMGLWLSELTNQARELLRTPYHVNVQADECLFDEDYALVRQLATTGGIFTVERLNFWLDSQHLLPPNEKVGSTIVRLAPSTLPSIGDAQGFEHSQGWLRSGVRLAHYGFIRDARALVTKARPMQQAFFGTQDAIWDAVEREGLRALGDAKHATAVPSERLLPYNGPHPKVAHQWLREHRYSV